MKTIALALFVACLVGSSLAQDCSAKIKDFHDCLSKGHKKDKEDMKAKFGALKAKIGACYTDNGCTAPVKGQKGKGGASGGSSGGASGGASGEASGASGEKSQGRECGKAIRATLKKNFIGCLQKAGVSLPAKGQGEHDKHGHHFGGHHKGFDHKGGNKALEGCAKKEAVRDCQRALFNKTRPNESEMKAKFEAHCQAKQQCLTALGAACQAQIQKFKKAACECRQQQFKDLATVRASTTECAGVADRKGKRGQGKGGKAHEQKSCGDEKNYCQLGFDALVADMKAKFGSHH